MTFITFIYKIENDTKTYYGKYCCNYISDDHEELDIEVKYNLLQGLNKYRTQNNLYKLDENNITIGILSFSYGGDIPTFSTNSEIQCFDFYCINLYKQYINGNLL